MSGWTPVEAEPGKHDSTGAMAVSYTHLDVYKRQRVARWRAQGHDIVVVPSAMSGETNRLIGLAKEISKSPNPRELDVIASTGEQVTIALLAMAMHEEGLKAKSYTGPQAVSYTHLDVYKRQRSSCN